MCSFESTREMDHVLLSWQTILLLRAWMLHSEAIHITYQLNQSASFLTARLWFSTLKRRVLILCVTIGAVEVDMKKLKKLIMLNRLYHSIMPEISSNRRLQTKSLLQTGRWPMKLFQPLNNFHTRPGVHWSSLAWQRIPQIMFFMPPRKCIINCPES